MSLLCKKTLNVALSFNFMSLMTQLVSLHRSGPMILSGDQWHFTENHRGNGVPTFNYNRAETLTSSDKLNKLLKNRRAKLIIQHEPKDRAKLPALPEYVQ